MIGLVVVIVAAAAAALSFLVLRDDPATAAPTTFAPGVNTTSPIRPGEPAPARPGTGDGPVEAARAFFLAWNAKDCAEVKARLSEAALAQSDGFDEDFCAIVGAPGQSFMVESLRLEQEEAELAVVAVPYTDGGHTQEERIVLARELGLWKVTFDEPDSESSSDPDGDARRRLRNSFTAEKIYYTDNQRYTDDPKPISEIETTITYVGPGTVASSATRPGQVHLTLGGGGQIVCLSVLSDSGRLFMIKDIAEGPTAGTYYAEGSSLPPACDETRLEPAWS